jgi:hypothetical protein
MNMRDLDLLARAASYGTVDLEDLVPPAKRTARLSRTRVERNRTAFARLRSLEMQGYLAGSPLNSRFEPTAKGFNALKSAGFSPNKVGYWLRPDAVRPGWSL